jgi:hypothetical protein
MSEPYGDIQGLIDRRQFDVARARLQELLRANPDDRAAAILLARADDRGMRARAAAHKWSVIGPVLVILALAGLRLYFFERPKWGDPAAARRLVESAYAYEAGQGGPVYSRIEGFWDKARKDYGGVVSWRITGQRRDILYRWMFDVDVVRTRAFTKETIDAVGPSSGPLSGRRYPEHIGILRVVSSKPR